MVLGLDLDCLLPLDLNMDAFIKSMLFSVFSSGVKSRRCSSRLFTQTGCHPCGCFPLRICRYFGGRSQGGLQDFETTQDEHSSYLEGYYSQSLTTSIRPLDSISNKC